ncbi:hypothetical protein BGW42_007264 [Actinomortierella wolfii]|nr:hypothetical protein BGW42_007264 [Actinomortierella wolfii]
MATASTSLSGIVVTSTTSTSSTDGKSIRVIPSTRRPDGTYRKERKVREGYIPPEDVERYTNARLASARPTPAQLQKQKEKEQAERLANMSKAQKKNEKRKAKRKEDQQQQQQQQQQHQLPVKATTTETVTEKKEDDGQSAEPVASVQQEAQDPAKLLRALKKKLTQAKTLKERQDNGETLLPEQAEKVAKIDDLQAQISSLQIS